MPFKIKRKSYGAKNQITLDTIDNIPTCLKEMGKHNVALEIYNLGGGEKGVVNTEVSGTNFLNH